MRLRQLVARLSPFRGRRREDELNEEIAQHVELLTEEYSHRGLSPSDARDAALRSFGGIDRIRLLHREQRGLPGLNELVQDTRFALRLLLRSPRFGLSTILVLGLGIGINNMFFTLIYGHTMRGLPIDQADRVLHVSIVGQREATQPLSYPEFETVQTVRGFSGVAAFSVAPVTLSDEDHAPDRFLGSFITSNAFELIGVSPSYGRGFTTTDDQEGAPPVVLINQRVWQARYGSDPAVLGRTALVNSMATTIVGIVPDQSGFPTTAEVWQPLARMPGLARQNRGARTLQVFGRVRDDVEADLVSAEVQAVLATTVPGAGNEGNVRGRVVPISQQFFGRPTDPAWIAFIAAATLVLVVSCANAANLMLARASLRTRELAIRGSLGASRLRVVRQLLVESAVLAAVGGALGCGVSIVGARLAQSLIPENAMPYWLHYRMDATVLAALIGVSFATVLVFGLVPAIQASTADVNELLKAGGRGGPLGRGTSRWTTAFLTAQFGLTVVLLAYAVTDIRSRGPAVSSDAAIESPTLLSAVVTLPGNRYGAPSDRTDFYRTAYDQLGSVHGVSSFTIASALPRRGATERRLDLDGTRDDTTGNRTWTVSIGSGFFQTLGLPLVAGREFDDRDGVPGDRTVVVNQRFVDLFSTSQNPVGRRVRLGASDASSIDGEWLTIVGVAPDIRHRDGQPDPVVYLPINETAPTTVSMLIRTSGEQGPIIGQLRDEMRRIDSNLPLYRVMTVPQAIDEVAWVGEMSSHLARTLTLAALLLAVAGLYAVTAHAVGQRSREIGLRMALGARAGQVRQLIVKRAAFQMVLGLVVGILCTMAWDAAFFGDRLSRDSSVIRFASPEIVGPIAVLLVIVTLVACVAPVRRATRLDPVTVLREE